MSYDEEEDEFMQFVVRFNSLATPLVSPPLQLPQRHILQPSMRSLKYDLPLIV